MRGDIIEIHLGPGDDLAAIEAQLKGAASEQVLLIVPRGCKALRRLVNLKLLARHARKTGKGLALLTSDATVHALAKEAGLSAFTWRALALRLPWCTPGDVRHRPTLQELARALPRPPKPRVRRPRQRRPWLVLPVFLVLLGLVAALSALLVPQATITLTPATKEISHHFEVLVDPEVEAVDVQERVVPARRLTVTFVASAQSGTMQQKDAPDAPATGFVTLINRRPEPTTIPAGAIVSTGTGVAIRFQTQEEVTVPPLGSARVRIQAMEPGPSGNVRALAINSIEPRYALLVNVVNNEPTTGGTVKRVGVVTLQDKERLRSTLLSRVVQEAAGHLEGKLEPGEFLVPESIGVEVLGETFGEAVDVLSDVLSLQMQLRARGLAVAMADVGKVATGILEDQVAEGFELVPESLQFQPLIESATAEGNQVRFEVRVWGTMVAKLDRGQVIATVRGLPIEDAAHALARKMYLADAPEVVVKPDWLEQVPWLSRRLPWLGLRVQVVASNTQYPISNAQ